MFRGLAFLDKPPYLQRKCAAKPLSRDFHNGSAGRNWEAVCVLGDDLG